MFKVYGFLARKEGMTPEEFQAYYESHHVPLVLGLTPPPLVYKRNYLVRGDAFNLDDHRIDFDVVTELAFADRSGFDEWLKNLDVAEVSDDEAVFMDRARSRISVIDEKVSYS